MSLKQDNEKIRRAALGWLARRDYSQQEIIQKLKLKKYLSEDIKTLVKELVESGLINENRFTENYTYWRRNKGYGPLRIMQELQARGIPQEMIAEHLQIADNAWFAIAERVLCKHFKSKAKEMREHAKRIRFLQYRGFTQEQIEFALKSFEYL